MPTSVKVPKTLPDKFSAITVLTDAFSKKHLNDEYLQLIHQALAALAVKKLLIFTTNEHGVFQLKKFHALYFQYDSG